MAGINSKLLNVSACLAL